MSKFNIEEFPWLSHKSYVEKVATLEEAILKLKEHETGNIKNRIMKFEQCVNECLSYRIKSLQKDLKRRSPKIQRFKSKIDIPKQLRFIEKYKGRRSRETGDVGFSMDQSKGWLNSKRGQIYPSTLFCDFLDEICTFVDETAKIFEPDMNQDYLSLHNSLVYEFTSMILKIHYQPKSNHASTKRLFTKNSITKRDFVKMLVYLGATVTKFSTLDTVADDMGRKGKQFYKEYISRKKQEEITNQVHYNQKQLHQSIPKNSSSKHNSSQSNYSSSSSSSSSWSSFNTLENVPLPLRSNMFPFSFTQSPIPTTPFMSMASHQPPILHPILHPISMKILDEKMESNWRNSNDIMDTNNFPKIEKMEIEEQKENEIQFWNENDIFSSNFHPYTISSPISQHIPHVQHVQHVQHVPSYFGNCPSNFIQNGFIQQPVTPFIPPLPTLPTLPHPAIVNPQMHFNPQLPIFPHLSYQSSSRSLEGFQTLEQSCSMPW